MNKLSNFMETRRRCGHHLHVRPQNNAARERTRVKTLRSAFLELQKSLPAVPPNTKLSKLDVLVLATAYIYHLTTTLEGQVNKPEHHVGGQCYEEEESRGQCHKRVPPRPIGQRQQSESPKIENKKRVLVSLSHSDRISHKHSKTSLSSSHPITSSHDRVQKSQDHRRVQGLSRVNDETWRPVSPEHILARTSRGSPLFKEETRKGTYDLTENQTAGLEPWQRHARGATCLRKVNKTAQTIGHGPTGILHPVKKWPMRSRLYDSILGCTSSSVLLPSYPQSTTSSFNCSECNSFTDVSPGSFH